MMIKNKLVLVSVHARACMHVEIKYGYFVSDVSINILYCMTHEAVSKYTMLIKQPNYSLSSITRLELSNMLVIHIHHHTQEARSPWTHRCFRVDRIQRVDVTFKSSGDENGVFDFLNRRCIIGLFLCGGRKGHWWLAKSLLQVARNTKQNEH